MSVYRIYQVGNEEQFYIGSTNDFNNRKKGHKERFKKDNQKVYQYIRNNGGWDNFKMEVLEYSLDYYEREKELIRTLNPPLNTNLYNFNKRECDRKYREENKDKYKEYMKIYREENKDKIIQQGKKRYEEKKDKINEKAKIYREKNKDKIREQKKKYCEENKDKINEKKKKYYQENKDKINEKKKIYHAYQKSWGGDERRNNNLLKIDITIFD